MGQPRPLFSFIFGLFKQTIQFLQQINLKKCHPLDQGSRPYNFHLSKLQSFCLLDASNNFWQKKIVQSMGIEYGYNGSNEICL